MLDAALEAAKAKREEADLEIAAITAVVDNTCAYQDHGHRSVNGYLKQQLNCSAGDATRIKLRGRLINQHPAIGDALGASRIGAGQTHLSKPDGTVIKPLGARDPIWPDQQPQHQTGEPEEPDTFDAPIRTTTWAEHTRHRRTTTARPGRHPIPNGAIVHVIDLRAGSRLSRRVGLVVRTLRQ